MTNYRCEKCGGLKASPDCCGLFEEKEKPCTCREDNQLKEKILMWQSMEEKADKLANAMDGLINFIPIGWEMPLGFSQIINTAEKALKELKEYLEKI